MIQILGQAVDKAAGDVQPTTSKAGVRGQAEIKLRARVRVLLFCVIVDKMKDRRPAFDDGR